jgi:DNA-binding transcriptional LysR family regulator
MNPRALDVQLLFAFDALMRERQVTRAAHIVGVSQPAMSHMLARLRDQFGDPLLVRTTRGMEPTPRAVALIDPVRLALRQLHEVFEPATDFDPATSTHTFTFRMGDMNEFILLPTILEALQREAPGVRLRVQHLSPVLTLKALDSGEIDFAISTRLAHAKTIRNVDLLEDRMVCIMRAGHPWARRRWTPEEFLALRHINIVQSLEDTRFAEYEHARSRRNIVLNIPHWLAAAPLVEQTDLVTSLSQRMARRVNDRRQLVIRELPVGRPDLVWRLYWHRRHDSMAAQCWMRALVLRACGGLRDRGRPGLTTSAPRSPSADARAAAPRTRRSRSAESA